MSYGTGTRRVSSSTQFWTMTSSDEAETARRVIIKNRPSLDSCYAPQRVPPRFRVTFINTSEQTYYRWRKEYGGLWVN